MNIGKTSYNIATIPDRNNMISQKTQTVKTSTIQRDPNPKQTTNKEVVNPKEIETVVESLNEFIDPLHTNLKFVFHEELNEYYVTVVNPFTNEVIREIPPKKMLDMYAAMTEYMGMLIDEKI